MTDQGAAGARPTDVPVVGGVPQHVFSAEEQQVDPTTVQDDPESRTTEERAAGASMEPDPYHPEEEAATAKPLDAKSTPSKRRTGIDAEELAGRTFAYQHDLSLVEGIDLVAATPGGDINWLEDVELLTEDGAPAVFDRYSNSFLKIYFPIPEGREHEIARKVLVAHLQAGNSYGIQLKRKHAKFRQPLLEPWVQGAEMVGDAWQPPVLEGWQQPSGH